MTAYSPSELDNLNADQHDRDEVEEAQRAAFEKAEALRAEAKREYALREESFQRSDTDGFLSQWAHGLQAQKLELAAQIAIRGGLGEFEGLFDGERRVAAKLVESTFNGHTVTSWCLHPSERERYGRSFVPAFTNGKSRILKKLGLTEASELAPAKAVIQGRGRGLSGSAWAAIERTGDPWGRDAVRLPDDAPGADLLLMDMDEDGDAMGRMMGRNV